MSNLSSKEKLIQKIERDLEEERQLKLKFEREQVEERLERRKGFVRRLQLEKREAELDGVLLKAQEVAKIQQNDVEQEERLAAELAIIRQEEIKDEKLRQQLRENSHELKELEKNLKAAYANKILKAQIAEKEAHKAHQQMMEERGREVMLSALGNLEDAEYRELMQEKIMKEEYRRTLQDQIIEKERLKQEDFISYLKEKKLFEDTIKKIKDEDEREKAEKLLMKQKVKEEMEKFYTAREIWKAKERMMIDKEKEKLEADIKLKEQQEAERNANKKSRNVEHLQRIFQQKMEEVKKRNREKEELQEMLSMVRDYELEEKEARKAEDDHARELMTRREARMEFQRILAERERISKKEKELDENFIRQMNLKVAEEDQKEKERMQAKRMNRINDRKYNEEKIKQNIEKHAEELKLIQMAIELEEKEEKRRMEMIEEERIRILKEHAPNLLGYFPKGCLKERDLELLGITGNSPLPEASAKLMNK